jgi:Flp pilus assembly secretin CpaC
MKARIVSLTVVVVLSLTGSRSAYAQAVQLPTFDFFTVNTTVSVPDGGTALLGGINSYAAGRTEGGVPMLGKVPFFGRPFGNRAIGSNISSSNVTATARIIIPEEEEAKLGLSGSPSLRHEALSAVESRANFLARNMARHDPPRVATVVKNTGAPTPEEIRRRNVLAGQERDQEATFFYEKGNVAFTSGKLNVAKIYYRMAANRAEGELKSEILGKLHATTNPESLSAGVR